MSRSVYKLYVDELGMSHPKSYEASPYYILLGCIIEEAKQRELHELSAHIKYKYWGRTDVIFHSAEIGRSIADFAIFRGDEEKKREFIGDLFDMLQKAPVHITAAVIDKKKAYQNSWSEVTVIKRAAVSVLFNFLAFIYTKKQSSKGHVIIEASSAHRDGLYLSAFNTLLSPSFRKKNPDFTAIRSRLTSINFVTKQNHDIESQVADLLVYGIRCQLEEDGGGGFERCSYEAKIMKIANAKLIRPISNMSLQKKKFYDLIKAVDVQPRRKAPRKKKSAVEP